MIGEIFTAAIEAMSDEEILGKAALVARQYLPAAKKKQFDELLIEGFQIRQQHRQAATKFKVLNAESYEY
jgi:hypothetical protein